MFLLTDTRNLPPSNSPSSKTRHVRFQLHSKLENILGSENKDSRNNDDVGKAQKKSSSAINHNNTKASQDSLQDAKNTTKENFVAADNGRLAAGIIILHKKNEETSEKLALVQGKLNALEVEKNNLQEKLVAQTASEQILANEKKELEKTNFDLEDALQRLEEDYDELEEDLYEEREFGIEIGKILQLRTKELRFLEVQNNFLEEKLEAHVAAELVLTREIEELRNELQRMHKLDEDYKQSLKEQSRLQDQMDGLRDVVEGSTEVLMIADGIIKDLEIKVMDRTFHASQLSCELEAAFENLREIEELNKVNLKTIKCDMGDIVNQMREDFDREMNIVKTQKEEEQGVLTDHIAALNDVLEGTTEELIKAHGNIRDMEIKAMDRAFYISELSHELDVALERLRQTENNPNSKLSTVSDTQVEERNVYLVAEFGKYIEEINFQKRKADEIAERLEEVQQKAEKERLEYMLLERKLKKHEKTIAQLKRENLKKVENVYIDETRRSLSAVSSTTL